MRTKPELKTLCTCLFAFCWSKLCQIINLCYRQMIVVATLSNKFRMEKTEILNKLLICFNLDIFFSFFYFCTSFIVISVCCLRMSAVSKRKNCLLNIMINIVEFIRESFVIIIIVVGKKIIFFSLLFRN